MYEGKINRPPSRPLPSFPLNSPFIQILSSIITKNIALNCLLYFLLCQLTFFLLLQFQISKHRRRCGTYHFEAVRHIKILKRRKARKDESEQNDKSNLSSGLNMIKYLMSTYDKLTSHDSIKGVHSQKIIERQEVRR